MRATLPQQVKGLQCAQRRSVNSSATSPAASCSPLLLRSPAQQRASALVARDRRVDSPIMPVAVPVGGPGEEQYVGMMEYLLRNRIIFLGSRISEDVCNRVCASLMALEAIDPKAEIKMYVNSTGASAYAAVAIVDIMKQIQCPISTVGMGMVGSNSVLVLAAGTKGRRFIMPTCRVMIHQPQGGSAGSADEVNIQTAELNRTMRVVQKMFSDFTGQPLERIEEETDRDNFMTPQEAVEFGLVDGVVSSKYPSWSYSPEQFKALRR